MNRRIDRTLAPTQLPGLLLSLFLVAVPLVTALPATGQDTPPPAEALPGIFGEIIDVRVVNIEVVVEDRSGNRVTGLGPEDFRLVVDGNEVPIDYFTEVQGGLAVADEGEPKGAPVESLPALAPGRPVSTSYLVFIDDFFSIERDRNRVLEALREEIPLLNPEDRMAVVAYDGKRLEMLSSWTQSQAGLDRAFKEAVRRPAYGLNRTAEQRRVFSSRGLGAFEQIRYLDYDDITNVLNPEERDYVRLLSEQIQAEISAAAATLRSFAMPPGRKVMLLLSGGWPFDPPQLIAADPNRPVLDTEFDRGFELYQPLVSTANLLGYTLYPIDVPGLRPAGPDASVQTASATPLPATLSEETEIEASLSYIADRTGGQALINSASLRPLTRTATDTRSYYWLGFTPARQWDDGTHRIKVEVEGRGMKVRSRRGYLDFSRQAEVTAMVESTLLFGSAPPGGGSLPVQLGETKKARRGRVETPLTVAIPVDAITVLPVGGRYVAELELRIAVLDEDGHRAEIPVIPLRLDGEQPPKSGSFIRYDTTVKLRKKKHEIVIALYDPASGRILSNRLEVNP